MSNSQDDPKNQENGGDSTPGGVNRRRFISAIGATAASAVFLQHFAKGQNGIVYYQDSFGDVLPASPDMMTLGIAPVPAQVPVFVANGPNPNVKSKSHVNNPLDAEIESNPQLHHDVNLDQNCPPPTSIQPGYTSPNFLMIMVDQLRAPRWLPGGPNGVTAVDTLLPNIAYLRQHSYNFSNYFVAATACSPSRSTLLTGLYTQQTCIFQTEGTNCQPVLQTGFPNIAKVLSQTGITGNNWIPYSCYWIGKWHLSDAVANGSGMGADGPYDYGFKQNPNLNLPGSSAVPSPNGLGNLATEGFTDSGAHPTSGMQPDHTNPPSPPNNQIYCDAAICDFFIKTWLPNAPSQPWFTAVSLVNPHDITSFPFCYNLSGTPGFGSIPAGHSPVSYPPPVPAGSLPVPPNQTDTSLPALSNLYNSNTFPPPSWNYPDAPAGYLGGGGKPDLQSYYQKYINNTYGAVTTSGGWQTFLNYYLWMQNCVDIQVKRVTDTLSAANFPGAGNTIVMFLSDHGDYGGSHSLKAKGGALYDESINVPLYVSFPGQRSGSTPFSAPKPYVCSSVDILPFLYSMALGSDYNWRQNSCDIISYLNKRESIMDAIYSSMPKQHRVSNIPNKNGMFNTQNAQPFVIHTSDEISSANIGTQTMPIYAPSHPVAFRTVDLTVTQTNPDGYTVNGGGKLGVYSFWPTPNPNLPDPKQTKPDLSKAQQFEFYDYTHTGTGDGNLGETGNEYTTPAEQTFLSEFQAFVAAGGIAQNELYATVQQPWPANLQMPYNAALLAYLQSQGVCPAIADGDM